MRRFQTLGELIGLYAQPNQGLVCALLLPVEGEREPDPPDDRDASGIVPPAAGESPSVDWGGGSVGVGMRVGFRSPEPT